MLLKVFLSMIWLRLNTNFYARANLDWLDPTVLELSPRNNVKLELCLDISIREALSVLFQGLELSLMRLSIKPHRCGLIEFISCKLRFIVCFFPLGWSWANTLRRYRWRSLQRNRFHRLLRNILEWSRNQRYYFNWRDRRTGRRKSCRILNETQFSKFLFIVMITICTMKQNQSVNKKRTACWLALILCSI